MENRCPQCGAEQPPGEEWEQKLCPACLMKLGLSGAIPRMSIPEPEPAAAAPSIRPPAPKWNWRLVVRVVEGAALLALLSIAVLYFLPERSAPPPTVQMTILTPGEMEVQDLAVSPDGRVLAYTAATRGETRLWIRPLNQLESRELLGTEGASMPFWSPDSRSIGFFAGGKLKTIGLDGRPAMTIANAPQPHGGSWSTDGAILFGPDALGLQRVGSAGGEPVRVTSIKSARGSLLHRWPQFLPDGHHFLLTASGPESTGGIYVADIDGSAEARLLIHDASAGTYSDGRIFFVKDAVLMMRPFDARRLEFTGDPQAFRDSVGSRASHGPPFSVGGNMLAYRTGSASLVRSLLWIDRSGKVIQQVGEPAEQEDFALSPGGTRVAVVRNAPRPGAADLWLLDMARGAATRITFDARGAASPLWAPDGRRVAFVSRSSPTEFRAVTVNEPRSPEMLLQLPESAVLDSWSADGRFLLYTVDVNGRLAVWMLPLEKGDHKPAPLLKGDFNYKQASLSPDVRWVAYVSDESGRDEVYLRGFPSGEGRWMVSVNGGTQPSWGRDARELFYQSPERQLMSVVLQWDSSGELRARIPQPLFEMPPGADAFAVANDGRFLVAVPPGEQQRSPINVVINWASDR